MSKHKNYGNKNQTNQNQPDQGRSNQDRFNASAAASAAEPSQASQDFSQKSGENEGTDGSVNRDANFSGADGEESVETLAAFDRIMDRIHEVGDLLERAGSEIQRSGYMKIGQAFYKLGDRLEHLMEGTTIQIKTRQKRQKQTVQAPEDSDNQESQSAAV